MTISDELEQRLCRLRGLLGLSYQEVLERVIGAGLEVVENEVCEQEKKQHNPEWLKWLRAQLLEQGKTYQEIGDELGVSREMVRQYCLRYGIDIKQRTARWYAKRLGVPELETPDWLLAQPRSGLTALARKLGLSPPTLKNQIKRLGLDPKDFSCRAKKVTMPCSYCGRPVTRRAYFIEKRGYQQFFCDRRCLGKWLGQNFGGKRSRTPEEEAFIRANWQKFSDQEIAEQLGRSLGTIRGWRCQLGLLRAGKGKRWTDDEIWFLRKYYPQRTATWIGEILGRTPEVVYNKAQALGIRKRAKKTEAPP